jgi:hypothetical protein
VYDLDAIVDSCLVLAGYAILEMRCGPRRRLTREDVASD